MDFVMDSEKVRRLRPGLYMVRWIDGRDFIVLIGDGKFLQNCPRGVASTINTDVSMNTDNIKSIGYLCRKENLEYWPRLWEHLEKQGEKTEQTPMPVPECGLKELSTSSDFDSSFVTALDGLREAFEKSRKGGDPAKIEALEAKVRGLETSRDRWEYECRHERYRIRVKDFREKLLRHWMTGGVTPMKFYYHHESLVAKDLTVIPVRHEVSQVGLELIGVCLEIGSMQRYFLSQVYPPRTKPEIDNNEAPAKVL